MSLLALPGERMVVTLGTIDLRSINERRDRFRDLLVIISALKNEPQRTLVLRLLGPGGNHLANHFIPSAILLERAFEQIEPAAFTSALFAPSRASPHQQSIPDFPESARVFTARQPPVHQRRPLLW